jgi:hypothetical protein
LDLVPALAPAIEEPSDKGPMDWNAFDFSKDESFNAANDEIAQEALDVDTFFKSIDGTAGQGEAEENVSEEEVRASVLTLPSIDTMITLYCRNYVMLI